MDESIASSMVSARNMTSESTLNEQDLREKTQLVLTLLKVINSRNATVITATELKKACNSTRSYLNETMFDMTCVSRNCKIKLDQLWTTVENMQLKAIGLKLLAFSAVTNELISKQNQSQYDRHLQLPPSGVNELAESIPVSARKLAIVLDEQNSLSGVWQKELEDVLNKQHQVVEMITKVGDHVSTRELHTLLIKKKERILKTKIARAAINCLLSKRSIDFEAHPDLLNMKIKWRAPLDNI